MLEVAAVAALLRGRNIFGVGLFLAAAWAFKQTSVGALIGILAALIHRGPRNAETHQRQ